jgi:hypothetical protein
MDRTEFKERLADIVDGCVNSNRELTESDQESLIDTIGDVAATILDSESGEAEEGEDDKAEPA